MNSHLKNNHSARLFSLIVLLGLLATPLASIAQGNVPHHFASLQLLHPVATSPNPETTTNLRLSVLYGRSGGIRGLDINAIAGVNSGDALVLQLTGLYARTDGLFQGMAFTGGLQHLTRDGAGFQFSGLSNYVDGTFAGVQVAGLLNYTSGNNAGAQISGAMNLNDGAGTFLQLASVANVNAGPFAGFQVSTFMNSANEYISGAQAAILNYANHLSGVQVGVMNFTDTGKGLQVGILNQTRTDFSGLPLGLVNVDATSRKEWMFYFSNLSAGNIGFRTVLNQWSSIVSVGYADLKGDVETSYFLGWNFGRNFQLAKKWDLTLDLGYQHIMPQKSDNPDENDRLHYSLQARALVDWHIKDNLGIVGSVGSSTVFDEYKSGADSETDLHYTVGIVLY